MQTAAINRDQLHGADRCRALIDEHHAGAGNLEVSKGLDLSRYEAAIRTRQGEADVRRGRPSC